jgi:hypothetical protein
MVNKHREAEITITETTVRFGNKPEKYIRVKIDNHEVGIPVNDAVYAHWKEQFLRETPTSMQKKRLATLMNVIRAAYLQGVQDGKQETGR